MNQEHLKILMTEKRAVHRWNKWRKGHPEILPDLSNANLQNRNLSNANFRRVNFKGANLKGAILCDADLSYAIFNRAILSRANLRGATLGETTFNETALDDTKFHEASIRATTFINVNLSVAEGLEETDHLGPSTLDFGTIYLSKGDIPEDFLYEAGIPDIFIEYIRSQGRKPFDYYSCFISYASEDQEFVERLHDDLEAEGVQCWLAPVDLKSGQGFPQRIEDAIRSHDKVIIVLSKNSIESGWVEREFNIAREMESEKRKVFIPVYLDHSYLSPRTDWVNYLRSHRHIGNFQDWKIPYRYETEFKKLLEILEKDEV